MAKRGRRKSEKTETQSKEPLAPMSPPIDLQEPAMVNIRVMIHDIGMRTTTVPAPTVDETLEKIWRTGFKQKMQSLQRTHQIYGPHMIDRIDIEPVRT